jgi:hypothetical protein
VVKVNTKVGVNVAELLRIMVAMVVTVVVHVKGSGVVAELREFLVLLH